MSSLKDKVANKIKKSNAKADLKAKAKNNKKNNDNDSNINEELKKEALELGATEDDLNLIKDIDIDDDKSEENFSDIDDNSNDIDIKEDLKGFMKDLGFTDTTGNIVPDDIDEEEEEEVEEKETLSSEENNEEDEEESEQSEQEEGNEEEVEAPEPKILNIKSKKNKKEIDPDSGFDDGQNHMVSSDKLIVNYDTVWYDIPLDPQINEYINNPEQLSKEQIDKLYARGKEYLELDNQTYYDEFTKDSTQRKFLSQMMSNGTLNDKISALTLLIQESPIHNIKSLDTLLNYCGKKSRNSILQSLLALKDLLINGLLPNDRKLRFFKNQPGLSMMLNKKTLAIFYFEDYLKKLFFKILEIFEKLLHDPIIHVRLQILTYIFEFLTLKPEQEFNLLKLGVNKLGDIDSKVSSKASYLLLKLQQVHPNMKSIIIDSIIDIVIKPNNDYHSTYYSIITLNQTILKRSEDEIANKLIKTYFTLFEKFLISNGQNQEEDDEDDDENKDKENKYENKRKKNFKKGKKGGKSVKNVEKTENEIISEKNSKIFSGLLTGVNRAFPFAQIPLNIYENHMDTLFKITHSSNFNTSIQALVLINQVTFKAKLNNDRYYRTLYESLLDSRIMTTSKQGIYLNLLYKSLKQDLKNIERIEAFVKRILQVCIHWINIGSITGFIYLLIQLSKNVPEIKNLLNNAPIDEIDEEIKDKVSKGSEEYDSRKRDPRFANADKSSLWEINLFLRHFHPSIQAYTNGFLNEDKKSDEIVKPDLGLFTITHFLDRFVYRNAKKMDKLKGSSIMQPLFNESDNIIMKANDQQSKDFLKPVNTENWLSKKIKDIKPEDKFFYQYFNIKQNAIKKVNKNEIKDFNEEDSEEDMNEDEVWNALVKSRPDVEEDSESEDGFGEEDFSDMSEAEEEDDSDELDMMDFNDDEAELSLSEGDFEESEEEEESKKRSIEESEEEELDERQIKNKKRKAHKKKLKELPLFASADDYSKYLVDSDN